MLADSPFTNRTAGDREAGARCPHCAATIAHGEEIVACMRCGAVHHVVCWHSQDGCGSFDCAPARRILEREPPAGIADHASTRSPACSLRRGRWSCRPPTFPATLPANAAGSRCRAAPLVPVWRSPP